jgi:hypothetical protein
MTAKVYFLRRADGTGPVKIGCSKRPQSRRSDISRQIGQPCTLEAVIDAGWIAESVLHTCLKEDRATASGREWFDPTSRVLGVLQVAKATSSFDKVREFMRDYQA